MTVRAQIGGGGGGFNLSFNEIIGHTPGRPGRDDAKKGTYENVNGNVLVVYSVNPQLVDIEARRNGKRTNRTGLTRTGMFLVEKRTGKVRLITANRDPDGKKEWKVSDQTLTIGGNPHLVDPPAEIQAGADDVEDDDEEE